MPTYLRGKGCYKASAHQTRVNYLARSANFQ